MKKYYFLFLIVLFCFVFGFVFFRSTLSVLKENTSCFGYNNYKSIVVNAVGVYEHSNGGNLININITLVPGNGQVFVNVKNMEIGVTFQDYLDKVWNFVNRYTHGELNYYNVYLTVSGNAEVVEGGSGSVMIALGLISLLKNKPMKKDFIVSGVLEKDGRIGDVLSLREKIKLAKKFGFKRFYVSSDEFYKVENISGIKIIPVSNIYQIIKKELET